MYLTLPLSLADASTVRKQSAQQKRKFPELRILAHGERDEASLQDLAQGVSGDLGYVEGQEVELDDQLPSRSNQIGS